MAATRSQREAARTGLRARMRVGQPALHAVHAAPETFRKCFEIRDVTLAHSPDSWGELAMIRKVARGPSFGVRAWNDAPVLRSKLIRVKESHPRDTRPPRHVAERACTLHES